MKGEGMLIMKNFNFMQRHSFSYSHKNEEISNGMNYQKNLQHKLEQMSDLIFEGFFKLQKFASIFIDKTLNDTHEHLDEIYEEYRHIRKAGVPIINLLSNKLDERIIDEETYKLLNNIIDYQFETTQWIVNKKLRKERIESVYQHLREVPYYLKTDLELKSLPLVEETKS